MLTRIEDPVCGHWPGPPTDCCASSETRRTSTGGCPRGGLGHQVEAKLVSRSYRGSRYRPHQGDRIQHRGRHASIFRTRLARLTHPAEEANVRAFAAVAAAVLAAGVTAAPASAASVEHHNVFDSFGS